MGWPEVWEITPRGKLVSNLPAGTVQSKGWEGLEDFRSLFWRMQLDATGLQDFGWFWSHLSPSFWPVDCWSYWSSCFLGSLESLLSQQSDLSQSCDLMGIFVFLGHQVRTTGPFGWRYLFQKTYGYYLVGGLFFSPNSWDDDPIWLSYFSKG